MSYRRKISTIWFLTSSLPYFVVPKTWMLKEPNNAGVGWSKVSISGFPGHQWFCRPSKYRTMSRKLIFQFLRELILTVICLNKSLDISGCWPQTKSQIKAFFHSKGIIAWFRPIWNWKAISRKFLFFKFFAIVPEHDQSLTSGSIVKGRRNF